MRRMLERRLQKPEIRIRMRANPGMVLAVNCSRMVQDSLAIAVSAPVWSNMKPERSMELSYAKQFSVDYYDGGYDLIQVQDDSTYLVVPEEAAVPEGLPASITVFAEAVGSCIWQRHPLWI